MSPLHSATIAVFVIPALLLACRGGSSSSLAPAASSSESPATSVGDASPRPSAAPSASVPLAASATAAPDPRQGDQVTAIAWQPRGHRAALLREHSVTLVDPAHPGVAVRIGPLTATVRGLQFSDDAAQALTHTDDGSLQLWSTATGAAGITLLDRAATLHGVCFSHDGKLLAASIEAADQSRTVRIWDTATGALLPNVAPPQEISAFWQLAFLPDNRQLAGFDALEVVIWDIRSGKKTGGRGFETGGTSPVVLSRSGTFAAVSLGQHALIAWPFGAPREVHLDEAHGCEDHLNGISFSSDSRTLLARSIAGRSASWSVPSLALRSRWAPTLPEDQERGTMSDDGAIVLHTLADGSAEILDASTGRKTRALEGTMAFDVDASFSPDHLWIVQGGAAPAAWDVAGGHRFAL
jgi:WD40 repeat protein